MAQKQVQFLEQVQVKVIQKEPHEIIIFEQPIKSEIEIANRKPAFQTKLVRMKAKIYFYHFQGKVKRVARKFRGSDLAVKAVYNGQLQRPKT